MTRRNLIHVNDYRAYITIVEGGEIIREIETCGLHNGKFVKVDDGKNYPQLCYGSTRTGGTIEYSNPKQFAKECGGRLFIKKSSYDAAKAKLSE